MSFKLANVKSAPGIPDLSYLGKPQKQLQPGELVTFVLQKHKTTRRPNQPHYDLRLGTQDTGLFSWAIPKAKLPKPGERILATQTQVHDYEYGDFEGVLGEGYGAGVVSMADKGEALITKVTPKTIHFTVAHKKHPENYVLVKIDTKTGKDWLLLNKTKTKLPPGVGDKPKYRIIKDEDLEKELENAIYVQEKIDGAHTIYDIDNEGKLDAYSIRPSVENLPIVHTERANLFNIILPQLKNTTMRGEMYAIDASGKAVPFNELSGILNSALNESLKKQKEKQLKIQNALFDILRYHGQMLDNLSAEQKQKLLKQIIKQLPEEYFHLPKTAMSKVSNFYAPQINDKINQIKYSATKEKSKNITNLQLQKRIELLEEILSGKNPRTYEGIILRFNDGWAKYKPRREITLYLKGVFPGKRDGELGGILASRDVNEGPTIRIGTGFTEEQLNDIKKNLKTYINAPIRVEYQEEYESGLLRAPSFKGFEIDFVSNTKKATNIKQQPPLGASKSLKLKTILGSIKEILNNAISSTVENKIKDTAVSMFLDKSSAAKQSIKKNKILKIAIDLLQFIEEQANAFEVPAQLTPKSDTATNVLANLKQTWAQKHPILYKLPFVKNLVDTSTQQLNTFYDYMTPEHKRIADQMAMRRYNALRGKTVNLREQFEAFGQDLINKGVIDTNIFNFLIDNDLKNALNTYQKLHLKPNLRSGPLGQQYQNPKQTTNPNVNMPPRTQQPQQMAPPVINNFAPNYIQQDRRPLAITNMQKNVKTRTY